MPAAPNREAVGPPGACDLIGEDVYDSLGTKNAVAALRSFGSGGREAVAERLAA